MKNVNYTGFRVDLDQEAKKCIAFLGHPVSWKLFNKSCQHRPVTQGDSWMSSLCQLDSVSLKMT